MLIYYSKHLSIPSDIAFAILGWFAVLLTKLSSSLLDKNPISIKTTGTLDQLNPVKSFLSITPLFLIPISST